MTYDNLTVAQKRVFHAARERLENRPWFRAVCLDNFPDHAACEHDFESAVAEVEMTTTYWDAPFGIFGPTPLAEP